MQQRGAVAQLADDAHLVGNDNDGYVKARVDVLQAAQYAARGNRVQRGSGLIRQNHFGVGRKRTGDADTLFLPARKLRGVMLGALG